MYVLNGHICNASYMAHVATMRGCDYICFASNCPCVHITFGYTNIALFPGSTLYEKLSYAFRVFDELASMSILEVGLAWSVLASTTVQIL